MPQPGRLTKNTRRPLTPAGNNTRIDIEWTEDYVTYCLNEGPTRFIRPGMPLFYTLLQLDMLTDEMSRSDVVTHDMVRFERELHKAVIAHDEIFSENDHTDLSTT